MSKYTVNYENLKYLSCFLQDFVVFCLTVFGRFEDIFYLVGKVCTILKSRGNDKLASLLVRL